MRTIVYDPPEVREHYAEIVGAGRRHAGTKARTTRKTAEQRAKKDPPTTPGAMGETPADGYLSKIAKYVPAETITLMALGFAAFKPTDGVVWWWVAGGAVVNCIYLFSVAVSQPATVPPPRAYFYILSVVALILWAMATLPSVQQEAGLTGTDAATKQTFMLALAAFIVPALDTALTKIEIKLAR